LINSLKVTDMDREQIIHFAMVSGLYDTLQDGMPGAAQWVGLEEELEDFAKLVAKHERKRIAKWYLDSNVDDYFPWRVAELIEEGAVDA
jgi:hypothetical protein